MKKKKVLIADLMFSLIIPMSSALFATPAPESEAHPHKPLLLQLEQRGENTIIQ